MLRSVVKYLVGAPFRVAFNADLVPHCLASAIADFHIFAVFKSINFNSCQAARKIDTFKSCASRKRRASNTGHTFRNCSFMKRFTLIKRLCTNRFQSFGRVSLVKPAYWKDLSPIVVMLSGSVISFNALHPIKASLPIFFTPFGNTIFSIAEQLLNASYSMFTTPSGITTLLREVHPLNRQPEIVVIF